MESELNALLNSLEREAVHYETLLSLALEQREHLIARRPEALQELNHRQAQMMVEGRHLERESRRNLETLGVQVGLGGEDLTLSSVAERVDASSVIPLMSARQRILSAIEQLDEAQNVNVALFESAMDSIQFTLHLLAKTGPSSTFHPGGSDATRALPLLLDRRA